MFETLSSKRIMRNLDSLEEPSPLSKAWEGYACMSIDETPMSPQRTVEIIQCGHKGESGDGQPHQVKSL